MFKLEINLSHGEEVLLGKISLILYINNVLDLIVSIDSYMTELLGEAT